MPAAANATNNSQMVNDRIRPRWIRGALAFLLGFVGFSSVGNYILTGIVGLPLYLPEPFFLALLVGLVIATPNSFRLKLSFAKVGAIVLLVSLWILLVLLAIDEGSLVEALSTGRGFLYGCIAGFFASLLGGVSIGLILSFMSGVLFGEALFAAMIAPLFVADYRGITPINLVAVFLIIAVAFVARRLAYIIGAIGIAVVVILLSGFRAPVAAVMFAIVFTSFLLGINRGPLGLVAAGGRIAVLFALAIVVGFTSVTYVLDLDPYAYQRVVDRSLPLLTGDIESTRDSHRLAKIKRYAVEEPGDILPAGFVGKARNILGDMNDAAFLNFTITMGVPLGLIAILVIVGAGSVFFVAQLLSKPSFPFDTVAAAFFPFFLLILFINGRFAYIVYESILTGLIIGYWFYSVPRSIQAINGGVLRANQLDWSREEKHPRTERL